MTAAELAVLHPTLFHVTAPGAWPSIARLGLLPAAELVDLFEVPHDHRSDLLGRPRVRESRLQHRGHGTATLSDNKPLSVRALEACLDDMTPTDWLAALNARVFFWASREGAARLLNARINRGRARALLEFDTLRLANAHAARIEISPINSGSTLRRPARRGRSTFAPLLETSYGDWRKMRGRSDKILEVVVRGGIRDIADFLVASTLSP